MEEKQTVSVLQDRSSSTWYACTISSVLVMQLYREAMLPPDQISASRNNTAVIRAY